MRQGGYAMLLSIFMLLGIGGLWLSATPMHSQSLQAETLALSKAKDALIHYAVNYIDLYGAQGAGLGHLPCPDTDEPSIGHTDSWHLDGPNPPCGQEAVESGWLPRHVNVENGRYHFHARSQQRLLYAVSEKYVNNPLGRAVNPDTYSDFSVGQFENVVALIVSPRLDTDTSIIPDWLRSQNIIVAGVAYAVITAEDINTQIMQRAGTWLVEKMNSALIARCGDVRLFIDCSEIIIMNEQCEFTALSNLLHWLSSVPLLNNCNAYSNSVADSLVQLEAVPLMRHWFFRNNWHQFLTIDLNEQCVSESSQKCLFRFSVRDQSQILVELQPVSTGS